MYHQHNHQVTCYNQGFFVMVGTGTAYRHLFPK